MVDNMTGYQSKKAMAQAKLEDDDDIQTYTREWVGLTNEIIEDIFQSAAGADEETHIRFARAIEQHLRSKNT
jgi:hypothetical protein